MTATGFIQVNQSSFKDLHRQLKATYRMAAMRAAMHNESPTSNLLPSDPNSLEHHFSSLFKALPQGLRPMTSKFSFEGQRLFHSNATDLQSRLGTLSKVNFAGDPLAKQAVNRKLTNITAETPLAKTMRTNYNFSNLTKWMESVQLGKSTGTSQPPQPPQPPQPAHTKLRFKLASLKCEDETDWDFGDDTISMGGMAVDSTIPQVRKIQEFQIKTDSGQDFTNGRQKRWNPDLTFIEFNLQTSQTWPRTFIATFMLFEKDMGGATDFLRALWDGTQDEILPLITQLAEAAVTGAVAGTVSGVAVGGPLGAVAGVLVGIAASALIAVLIEMSKDDIIGDPDNPVIAYLVLEDASKVPGYSSVGPIESFDFKGTDALYRGTGYWELS
jgi:hypothetical protein